MAAVAIPLMVVVVVVVLVVVVVVVRAAPRLRRGRPADAARPVSRGSYRRSRYCLFVIPLDELQEVVLELAVVQLLNRSDL